MSDSAKLDLLLDKMSHVDTSLENIGNRLDSMDSRLENVESGLENVKARLENVETRLENVESGLENVKARLETVETRLETVETRLEKVENEATSIKLVLENEIRVNIQRVAEGYLDLSRIFHDAMQPSNEVEMLGIKVRKLESDMKEEKRKVALA